MSKSHRGGKRPGAGRPPTVNATIRATVTLDQATIDALKAISPNLSEAIRIAAARSS